MRCVAGLHYEVIRHQARHNDDIIALNCSLCDFAVYKRLTAKPHSSKSGLGRYNVMRGQIVRHLHKEHIEQLRRM